VVVAAAPQEREVPRRRQVEPRAMTRSLPAKTSPARAALASARRDAVPVQADSRSLQAVRPVSSAALPVAAKPAAPPAFAAVSPRSVAVRIANRQRST
jgi:hypothetical protein